MAYFVYFGLPVLLLIIGFPIFLVLLVTSIVAILTVAGVAPDSIQTNIFGALDNFPLLAVPFFVLAGEFMAQGGIARRIIAMVMAIVGGAVLTPIMGLISESAHSIALSYLVPLTAYVVILLYSFFWAKQTTAI